ncbi:MAG: DUF937 domain-containing protein [Acidobacteriota bacterium]
MTTHSILDSIQQQLGPSTIQQMSSALGADPASTSSAISAALPALLGGLSRNASQPEGAASLDQALGAHDGSILDNLGGLLGGGGGGIGGAILGHIFGRKRDAVEAGVSRSSGLDAAQVAQLLAMLAPIVMGVLGRMKREKGVDASSLPDVLGQASASANAAPAPGGFDLNSILDSNHDGDMTDDLGRIGKSVLGGLFGGK